MGAAVALLRERSPPLMVHSPCLVSPTDIAFNGTDGMFSGCYHGKQKHAGNCFNFFFAISC